MDFDAFTEGVLPGGLRNRSEIGVLVCYMLDSAGQPIPKDNLIELICENGFANYFETANAISELIRNNNVAYSQQEKSGLVLTKNGRLISSQLNTGLSLSIRQKAASAVAKLIMKRKTESENPVAITKDEGGGYQVNMKIKDGMRELMSLTVFVPDISEANAVKRSFHRNPERVYSLMLAAVIGEKDMIKSALEELR